MRALTLAQEAGARRWSVSLAGDFDETALRIIDRYVAGADVHIIRRSAQPMDLPRLMATLSPDVVHIDSYLAESDSLIGTAPIVSNIQDGSFGARRATLTVDPNLNAESVTPSAPRGQTHLAGVPFALIRQQVRDVRGTWRPTAGRSRVLIVLGGTDPFGQTPHLLDALSPIDRELEITVVAPESVRDEVVDAAARSPHNVEVVDFIDDLPAVAAAQDLVISAAGTSVWDLACVGVPAALVCVTENQLLGYDAAVSEGIAIGLRRSEQQPWSGVAAAITDLLNDRQRLLSLSERGMSAVDGLGPWRIVGTWEALLHPTEPFEPKTGFIARPATLDDAKTLLTWRNDPDTRRMSRTTELVTWESHVSWLNRVLADEDRLLLIIERQGQAVGTVRWDHRDGIDWEVSISLAPSSRGHGLSPAVLAAGEAAIGIHPTRRLIAAINDENAASRRLFEKSGYLPYRPTNDEGFAEYAKLVAPALQAEALG
ncbi:GNAT family N-acetyltransferase [Microbacterium sp.]|uniref:GNAT family N-acetyltransferase n=1 Tax=Microbacterium sp. TaxID=51671 RepID=UPI003A8D021D